MDHSKQKLFSSHGNGKVSRKLLKAIGDNVIIEEGVLIFHPEKIELGNNIYIGHKTILKGYYKNSLEIADGCWIGQGCYFHSAGGLSIGKSVGIGPFVKILTSQHDPKDLEKPVLHEELVYNSVEIKDGADIGTSSIILPGVTIGEGAIIGAGAVVTKNVPDFGVAVGCPAKIIKYRTNT
ncbi:MAG: acyltransferase [Melioribacteraceae bacterium]|nr:acyltransferase [Melioribacteraceae bacterium]MCF8428430.1 acyltransferase [Bacteroidia bacterium]